MGDKTAIVIWRGESAKEHDEGAKNHTPLKEDGSELGWLPDGWIVELYRAADGTLIQYYTSPISGYTFTSKLETLKYLFSGVDERILESKKCAAENEFQKAHEWLPNRWEIEIRAGGKNMDKMYKFYVEPQIGVRFISKDDVLLYLKESKISNCETNGQCDISSDNNIIAKVKLNPAELPMGWIQELVFRKTKYGSIRKDPYYIDPASGYTFRTVKSAVAYVMSGKLPKWAHIRKASVQEIYSFDKCADLHDYLRSRLTINPKHYHKRMRTLLPSKSLQIDQDGDIDNSEDGDTSLGSDSSSSEEEEATFSRNIMNRAGEEATSSRAIKTEAIEDEHTV